MSKEINRRLYNIKAIENGKEENYHYNYFEAKDEAAFYGPKLDILIHPAVGNPVALSTIQLDSLYNNYFYRNRMYIPCSSTLDKLTFDFLDENGNELTFNGNIYLLVNFKTI